MKDYLCSTIKEYLKDLSERSIVPGGGSASALVSALAAGLNLMAIGYSMKGKNLKEKSKSLQEEESKQQESFKKLSSLINKDCEVFNALMEKLSSKSDAEREYIAAAEVPMEICRQSCISLNTAFYLTENVNKNLMTDVGCAAHMLKAAFYSAKLNVKVNLKHITDTLFCESAERELKEIEQELEQVYSDICKRLKGF